MFICREGANEGHMRADVDHPHKLLRQHYILAAALTAALTTRYCQLVAGAPIE